MDQGEKALRIAAITEMFDGHGMTLTPERLRYYGRLTDRVPIEVFPQACRNAAIRNTSGFVPSPGQVISAALELAPGPQDQGSGERLKPRWYLSQTFTGESSRRRLAAPKNDAVQQIISGAVKSVEAPR